MKLKREVSYRPELVEQGVELSVRHLKQYFNFGHGRNSFKTKAVHDVSFDIKKGECFGLVGESGCGKTTTGRSLIRLYHITSGSIYFEGHRISAGRRWNDKEIKWSRIKGHNKIKELRHEASLKLKEEKDSAKRKEIVRHRDEEIKKIKAHIKSTRKEQKEAIAQIKYDNKHVDKKLMSKMQMIFQDPVDSLDPRMTVEDIIQEGLRIQGENNKFANSRKVAEVLERVGLIPEYASRYPHEFSGGQRQRIGIARALVMNPRFLICDEPISALDVSIRAQIINLLNDLKEEMGLTIMFIAHDLSVVKYFCDRIGVMYFGQLVELASSDELFRHPLHPYTNALLSAIPKPDPISEKKRQRIVYKPDEVHDYSKEKPQLVEIVPGHWVLANKPELKKYKEVIASLDKEAPVVSKAEEKAKEKALKEALRKQEEEAKALERAKAAEEARKAQEIAKAEEEQRRKREYARAHRDSNPDVPSMFKSKPAKKAKEPRFANENEREVAERLRRYRPEIEQRPALLDKKEEHYDLPLFTKKGESKEEREELRMFEKKPVEAKLEASVSAPKLESNKLVHLTKNAKGEYQLKQVGESKPIAVFKSNDEAMKFAYALKQVNGVSVCARDENGKVYKI